MNGGPENYFPEAADYVNEPYRMAVKYGHVSALASLCMIGALRCVEKRSHVDYEGTELGEYFEELNAKYNVDCSDGLIACMPVGKIIKEFDLSTGGTYKAIEELVRSGEMLDQWRIVTVGEEGASAVNVVVGCFVSSEDKKIYLKFNSDFEKDILQLKGGYTRMSIPVIGRLKEDYVINIYQLLKATLDREKAKARRYGDAGRLEYKYSVSLDEFMFLCGLYPIDAASNNPTMKKIIRLLSERNIYGAASMMKELMAGEEHVVFRKGAVEEFRRMRARYLGTAFRRINGFEMGPKLVKVRDGDMNDPEYAAYADSCRKVFPTDIHFRYSLERAGRGGAVVGLVFYVAAAADFADADTIVQEQGSCNMALSSVAEHIRSALLARDRVKSMPDDEGIAAVAREADCDMARIDRAFEVMDGYRGEIEDVVRFLIGAIKYNWQPGKTGAREIKKETPRNRFADFPQRQYSKEDYEEMERKMMNR